MRRVLHLAIAIAGWILFGYWWWLVFGRVSRAEVRFTAIFIAVTTLVAVTVTSLWSAHNKRMYRRGDRRVASPLVLGDFTQDTLGRDVSLEGGIEQVRNRAWVHVHVEGDRKSYGAAPGAETRTGFQLRAVSDRRKTVARA